MFSKTCEYAIRAVLFIAKESALGQRVGVKEIADGIDSPAHFMAKILQELTKQGLVKSTKGPGGGFYHDEHTLQYALIDIVDAIDGDKVFTGCGLGLKQCSESRPCPIHHQFKKARAEIRSMLTEAKIGELALALTHQLSFLKL